jgi:hypothetical protein
MVKRTQTRALTPIDEITFEEHGKSAWVLLLQAEKAALGQPSSATRDNSLVGIRTLGHLLEDFWEHRVLLDGLGTTAYARIIKEVQTCSALTGHPAGSDEEIADVHEKLFEFGLRCRNYILRVCELCYDPRHIWTALNKI